MNALTMKKTTERFGREEGVRNMMVRCAAQSAHSGQLGSLISFNMGFVKSDGFVMPGEKEVGLGLSCGPDGLDGLGQQPGRTEQVGLWHPRVFPQHGYLTRYNSKQTAAEDHWGRPVLALILSTAYIVRRDLCHSALLDTGGYPI